MELMLIDDGTLDTVFLCSDCGQEIRYLEPPRRWREEDGTLKLSAFFEAEDTHSDECEAVGPCIRCGKEGCDETPH